jgi:putative transcriptional regulator
MNCTELHELAAAQALGALDPADAARLAAHVARDPYAQSELSSFCDVTAALVIASIREVEPPAGLRQRILDGIARPRQIPTEATPVSVPGFHFVFKNEGTWMTTPIPGVRFKQLSISRDMGYQVLLGELAPGARLPEHDHAGSEEVFVLSGHLHTEGRVLGPGDLLHSEAGTHHRELISPDGCVALLIQRAPANV